jgi:cell division protein FtsB
MGRLVHFRRRGEKGWGLIAPSDARLDTLFPSDARPAEDPPPGKAPDPERERRRLLLRSAIIVFLATIFVAGSGAAIVGDHGYLGVRRSRQELAELKAKVDTRQDEVLELKKQVDRLKTDPHAVERIARERLGFGKPGEVMFLLPDEQDRTAGDRLFLPPPALKTGTGQRPADPPRD